MTGCENKLFILQKNTWWIEWLKLNKNIWNDLTVYKQMIDIKWNHKCLIEIPVNIYLCAIDIKLHYKCLIEIPVTI